EVIDKMCAFQTILDPTLQSLEVRHFENALRQRVVGQDREVRQLSRVLQVYKSGLAAPGRPVVNLLLLGPTGSGKTRLVEAAAEVLFGDSRAVVNKDRLRGIPAQPRNRQADRLTSRIPRSS